MADSGDNFLKGFILGGLVGGVLGILFAPKSGRDLRADLSVELDKAREDLEHARKAALKAFEESKERILETFNSETEEEPEPEKEKEEPKPRKRTPRRRTRPSKSESDT